MKTLKLNGFKRQVAVILMMLTTIDFLVGEKNQPGNKIGECMHNILEVIHKFSPWLLL